MPRLALILAWLAAGFAYGAESAAERWNLADLYPAVEAWGADAAKLDGGIRDFARCRGQLGRSAESLQRCLDTLMDLRKRHARLDVYASEKLSEDTGVPESLEL